MKASDTPTTLAGIFRKSSYSQSEAACVEVADLDNGTAIRDTKHRDLGSLFFGVDEWQAFIDSTKED